MEMERNLEDHDDNDSTIEEINSNIESFRSDKIEFIKDIEKSGVEIEDEENNYSYDDFTDNDEEMNHEINIANDDVEYTHDDYDDDIVSNMTSCKEDDVLFHFNLVHDSKNTTALATRTSTPASQTSTKKNLSFTSERVREIDRHNKILLKKILEKSSSPGQISRDSSNTSIASSVSNSRATSAAINRKKDQKKIDYENQILMRKLQQIQRRKVTY